MDQFGISPAVRLFVLLLFSKMGAVGLGKRCWPFWNQDQRESRREGSGSLFLGNRSFFSPRDRFDSAVRSYVHAKLICVQYRAPHWAALLEASLFHGGLDRSVGVGAGSSPGKQESPTSFGMTVNTEEALRHSCPSRYTRLGRPTFGFPTSRK